MTTIPKELHDLLAGGHGVTQTAPAHRHWTQLVRRHRRTAVAPPL